MISHQSLHFELPDALSQLIKESADNKPRVIVSACLTGQSVRFDGGHKKLDHIIDYLTEHLELIQFCPEMAAGMGVPREPIQWVVNTQGKSKVCQVNNPTIEFGHSILEASRKWLTNHKCQAAVLKARSPSCGSGSTPMHSETGKVIGYGDGLFTQILRQQKPVTIVDESYFNDSEDCDWFILGCYLALLQPLPDDISALFLWTNNLDDFLNIGKQQRQTVKNTVYSALNRKRPS